jgi:hypothetical protein
VTLAPKGLLIEEQRSNLLLRSEEFENAAWGRVGTTIVANTTASPNGITTADTLTCTAGLSGHETFQPITLTSGVSYTMSVFAKKDTHDFIQLRQYSAAGGASRFANFNLATGVLGRVGLDATATITDVGSGWYRCSMTSAPTATASGLNLWIIPSDTSASGAGFTATGAESVYLWGAQLEAGAFATSYIPTVASQVTRAADNASMIGNNFARWWNPTEGTLYGEASYQGSGIRYIAAARNAGATDATNIGFLGTAGLLYSKASNVDYALLTAGTTPENAFAKVAGAYKVNDFALSVKASTVATDTSGQLPVVDQMIIGNFTGSNILNGTIKRIAFYPRRLANSELTSITS